MAKPDPKTSALTIILVWLFRLLVGATFVISGWAKSIDPWGFIYKIEEYFTVWGLIVPRELTLMLAVSLAVSEFIIGILIFVGAMRRASVWLAAAFMAVMLPLTAYIFVADPVSDCGCFGDFIVLSNFATFAKNVLLTAMIIYLMVNNDRVAGVYVRPVQWLVALGALVYAGVLAFVGYRYQPLVDFRPYPVGSSLVYDEDSEASDDCSIFIYEKDGVTKEFSIEALPDSTWTFVEAVDSEAEPETSLAVFDDGEEVTADVFDGVGMQLFLAVSDPGTHYLSRARLANDLAKSVRKRGGRMIGLVAAEGDDLLAWKQLALPDYPVYSAEDTSLKELVRGDAALVMVNGGQIIWKRNLSSVSHDVIYDTEASDSDLFASEPRDAGKDFHFWLTLGLAAWMIAIYILSLPNIILSAYLRRRSTKNS